MLKISLEILRFHGGPSIGRKAVDIFKIPWDKSWAWPEIKFLSNPIEMQKYFIQEETHHAMWDTTGMTNLTTVRFPRLAVVPYAVVYWISKKWQKHNELMV